MDQMHRVKEPVDSELLEEEEMRGSAHRPAVDVLHRRSPGDHDIIFMRFQLKIVERKQLA